MSESENSRGLWARRFALLGAAIAVTAGLLFALSDNPKYALGEMVRGSALDAGFRMVMGEVRGRLRPSVDRCIVKHQAKSPTNIILIAVDTLRADHLGFQGYKRNVSPNIDALARDSLTFRQAISAAPWTTPAFVGVFTGSHPGALGFEGDPLLLPSEVPVLAQVLCEAGWQTAGVVSHSYVGVRYGFDRGFDRWDERNAGGHTHISSENITAQSLEFIDSFTDDRRPFFLFAHYFDPHSDYLEHEEHRFSDGVSGSALSEADNINELIKLASAGKLDAASVQQIVDSYDSEIAHTDEQIGLLIAQLKERGLYKDSMIIFLGDHGEMLVERPENLLGHGMAVYQALVHVPLLIKLPGSKRIGRIDTPVSTVDVLPTILDAIGHPAPPPSASGERSLLRVDRGSPRPVFAQTRRDGFRDTVLHGKWKLIRDTSINTSELYDVTRDEDERDDLSRRFPDVVSHMESLLVDWHKELEASRSGIRATAPPQLTPAEREQLRGLGYVE
jgi:arylsulfatase A-like enzyme